MKPLTHEWIKLWAPYEPILKKLTFYAVSFRYPGDNAGQAEARIVLKNCRSLRAEVRRSLGLKK